VESNVIESLFFRVHGPEFVINAVPDGWIAPS